MKRKDTGQRVIQDDKGFECSGCDKREEFGFYVVAHWSDCLVHTCSTCGTKHNVLRGRVTVAHAKRKRHG